MLTWLKSLLVGGAPVPPTEDDLEAYYEYEDTHWGSYPSPSEVYEWDVESYEQRLATPLSILIVWKYVATRKRTPRFIRTAAWKLCRPWFKWA